jgi:hypothetical protein
MFQVMTIMGKEDTTITTDTGTITVTEEDMVQCLRDVHQCLSVAEYA